MRRAFHPKRLLELAENLLSNSQSEEVCRTVVNRAYYGAYLMGFLKLRNDWSLSNAKSQSHSVHEQLQIAFETRGKANIASKLAELFDQRVIADYNPDLAVDGKMAKDNLELGRNIASLIEGDQ